MARGRRSRSGGSRPREARANVHSAEIRRVARLNEEALCDFLGNPGEETPFLLVLDGVQDPHNLGACIRSAEGAGVHAVVTPRHKASPVTETVVRISCGGAEFVPVVSVANMARFLKRIREEYGIRCVGTADGTDQDLYDVNMTGPLAVVLGAEGEGMRRLTMENCDDLVRIPMSGEVECLICLQRSSRLPFRGGSAAGFFLAQSTRSNPVGSSTQTCCPSDPTLSLFPLW